MKKRIFQTIMILCLVIVTVIVCVSCGGTTSSGETTSSESNLTISELQTSMKKTDESLSFEEIATANGYTYSATVDECNYTVTATEKKNVFSVKIETPVSNVNNMKDSSSFEKILNKSSGQITRADLTILNCVLRAICLKEAIDGKGLTKQETISFFSSQTPIKTGNWTISVTYTSSAAIINAVFSK